MREMSRVGLLWKFWYFLRLSCRIPNHRPSIFCPGDFIKHQHSSRIFKPLKAKIASEFIAVLKSCCNTICVFTYLFVSPRMINIPILTLKLNYWSMTWTNKCYVVSIGIFEFINMQNVFRVPFIMSINRFWSCNSYMIIGT